MSERILITGGSGQVGGMLVQALAPLAASGQLEVHAPGRAELDLADVASVRAAVQAIQPRWILNPGAYTAVDKAETDVAAAYAINAEAVGALGEEACACGAAVVHFSTDYVFPGEGAAPYRETDATRPLGVYGASKLAGEQALAASGAAHVILRTSWVYGATGKNFLLTVLRVARERERMTIVADQHGAPTTARELARVTMRVIEECEKLAAETGSPLAEAVTPVNGVYHAACAGETTWFGFAQEALRLRAADEPGTRWAELVPIPTSDYPTPARRPHNSRLDCSKLRQSFGIELKPWREALGSVMREIKQA